MSTVLCLGLLIEVNDELACLKMSYYEYIFVFYVVNVGL